MLSRRELLAIGVAGDSAPGRRRRRTNRSRNAAPETSRSRSIASSGRSIARSTRSPSQARSPISEFRFRDFIRSNGKFPNFCDIGSAVFYTIYDWHVRNRQQIIATRQQDNRYTIQFMFTTLILKFENEDNYIGMPYDRSL